MANMKYHEIDVELTDKEKKELEKADAGSVLYDNESPEMTVEMLREFKAMGQKNRAKQTASIRLSEKARRFSESYGKGYTSFLSRLIDAALDDATLVRKCL